jgi:hypothetical protein
LLVGLIRLHSQRLHARLFKIVFSSIVDGQSHWDLFGNRAAKKPQDSPQAETFSFVARQMSWFEVDWRRWPALSRRQNHMLMVMTRNADENACCGQMLE